MTKEEFREVVKILQGNWRYMLQKEDELLSWWTFLREYSYRDAKNGAVRCVLNQSEEPKIKDIREAIDAYKATEKQKELDTNAPTIHCIYCRDTGLITKMSPTGYRVGRPCDQCDRGRNNYPWDFMSEEEQSEWIEKENQKGRSVPRCVETPKEKYLSIVEGMKERLMV